jgi:hypothetical protein
VALDFDLTLLAELAGETLVEGSRNIRLNLPAESGQLLQSGMQLREAMLLPQAVLDLSVGLRVNGLERSGRWEARLPVPERRSDAFGLTDLALLHPADPTPLVYDVFLKGDKVFGTQPLSALPDPLGQDAAGRPALYVDGEVSRQVSLLAQVQVMAPPAASSTQRSPLRMDWELVPASGSEVLAPPVRYRRLQMVDQGRLLDVMIDLDLADVAPGDYTLRLTAQNLLDQSTDVRSVPVQIAR